MSVDPTSGAFEGIRVVELAQWVFVPVAGALLADWGADVVRVERLEGDPYRDWRPRVSERIAVA